MKCHEIKADISQLADNSLTDERMSDISGHLAKCPLCRDEVAKLKSVRSGLGSLPRPEFGGRAITRLRLMIAGELSTDYGYPSFHLIEGTGNWWQKWFMPTAVGAFSAAILGVTLLAAILIPSNVAEVAVETGENGDPLFLARIDPAVGDQFITAKQFALSRADVATESPSVNPDGTLVAMTNSVTNGSKNDDEVVVVAEIFGDGDARITNVVESSPDKKKMERLQAAFRPDRTAPPFVPASFDNRSDVVRVILKFQNVNVKIDADSVMP